MATSFYRGSTPTVRFSPQNGLKVVDLGEPVIAISQELVTLTFENGIEDEEDRITFNETQNFISVKLTEEESIQLADGVPTIAQVTWYTYTDVEDEDGDVYEEVTGVLKFPQHELTVLPSILDIVFPEDVEDVDDTPESDYADLPIIDPEANFVIDEGDGGEFVVPDYREYYESTTEPDPSPMYLYSAGVVDPVPNDWRPGE